MSQVYGVASLRSSLSDRMGCRARQEAANRNPPATGKLARGARGEPAGAVGPRSRSIRRHAAVVLVVRGLSAWRQRAPLSSRRPLYLE